MIIDNEEGLKNYYESSAEMVNYSDLEGKPLDREIRRTQVLIKLLNLKKDEKILDVGCGDGLQLKAFFENNPRLVLFGIDISEKRIERASEKVKASLFVGSAYKLPFKENFFDAVICSEVLEHVPKPSVIIEEIFRVLKKNGVCLISVPYKQKITYDVCANCGKLTPTSGHINYFDEEKLSSMFKESGFIPLKIKGAIGSASLIRPLRKIPYYLWRYFDFFIRKIRKDDMYLIGLAQK